MTIYISTVKISIAIARFECPYKIGYVSSFTAFYEEDLVKVSEGTAFNELFELSGDIIEIKRKQFNDVFTFEESLVDQSTMALHILLIAKGFYNNLSNTCIALDDIQQNLL
jgi:hypothetical protein